MTVKGTGMVYVRWWDSSINRIWEAVLQDSVSFLEFKADIEPENKILTAKRI